jgi:hypothetical protein
MRTSIDHRGCVDGSWCAPSGNSSAPIVGQCRRTVIEKRRAVIVEALLLFGDAPSNSSERVIHKVTQITGFGYSEL